MALCWAATWAGARLSRVWAWLGDWWWRKVTLNRILREADDEWDDVPAPPLQRNGKE